MPDLLKRKKRLDVLFFCTEMGVEPVREWLKNLPKPDKKTIGEDVLTVQYGWPLGMPLVKNLGHGLWEIRSALKITRRIARIIFFMDNNTMILVNGFIKKTQHTPEKELELAYKRKQQYKK